MPDDVKDTQVTDPGGQESPDAPGAQTTETTEVDQLPEWAKKELAELRAEAKKRRLQLREQEQAAAKAEEQRLVEQAKWQELAEKRGKELEALKPVQDKVQKYEEAFLATLNKRLEALPDTYKSVVPDFGDPVRTMEWLDANQHLFTSHQAPNIDAGAGNIPTAKGTPKLDAFELELAKSFGMSAEEYIKFREKGNAVKREPDK
jgi:hypothetical protein